MLYSVNLFVTTCNALWQNLYPAIGIWRNKPGSICDLYEQVKRDNESNIHKN